MRPIFIGGCSRSGTTLLGALLGAHSRCMCVPEMPFKFRQLRRLEWGAGGATIAEITDRLRTSYKFKLWGLDDDALRTAAGGDGDARLSYRETIDHLVRAFAQRVGRPEADVWVDHTPGNVRHVTRLLDEFPDARFVHIVRDGRGVAASLVPLRWGQHSVIGAANFWVRQLGYGLSAELWDPGRVTRIHFEPLLREPRRAMADLCERLGLEPEDRLGRVTRFALPRATSGQHALVRRPPQPDRATAWRRSLAPRQIEIFESIAGDPLRCLGYELVFGGEARRPSMVERAVAALRVPLGKTRNVPTHVRNFLFRRFGLGALAAEPERDGSAADSAADAGPGHAAMDGPGAAADAVPLRPTVADAPEAAGRQEGSGTG